ncbi:MAG: RNA-binding protein [Asticcacaulis sp.]|nr:RNA-binding protein [Asticcacaulis sp.]
MSPLSNNEPQSVTHDDGTSGGEPEVAILCEDAPGRLPKPLLRRDIASGASVDTARLVRFVVAPDGVLTPDLAEKLPGRGMWVAADRAALEIAVKRNIFSKAAKRQVRAAPELIPLVHDLLRRRCLDLLGLARREGGIVGGFEKVLAAVKSGKTAWLVEASDGAEDGRKRLIAAARTQNPMPGLCGVFSNEELSLALGQENAVHVGLLSGRRIARWSAEMARLSGFEPLTPGHWAFGETSP